MLVAGGTYFEFCSEPYWSQVYGSGVRAAAAISNVSSSLKLYTFVDDNFENILQSMASTFNFAVDIIKVPSNIKFYYTHGLSVPEISPSPHLIRKSVIHAIEGDVILRFGFFEGDAIVNGDRVIYDPQDAYNPRPFAENGSKANHLAIVANQKEASELSGESDTTKIGATLIQKYNAEVVVIKRGSFGALVTTSAETRIVPAYKTKVVWPIGSGDIFAAVFGHYWGENKYDPFEAANLASRATAYYCNNRSLPIPMDTILKSDFQFEPIQVSSIDLTLKNLQVYLAGPFFTMSQRWLIDQARIALFNQGFSVFSPFHDVGHGLASHVVPADINGLDKSQLLFAIVDGLDAGTLFEIGYAYAKKIPVIAFVQNETEGNLKMLEGTKCKIVNDFSTAIYKTVWKAMEL